jgi:DNA integrity scanning protein DisA with diadenylate cyclase activity
MKNLNKEILKVCFEIAKKKKGALIVVGNCEYTPLENQSLKRIKFTKIKEFIDFAIEDGAMVLDSKGILIAHNVWIKTKNNKTYKSHGTRHATALETSYNKNTICYVVSESKQTIKIFKKGRVLDIKYSKEAESKINDISLFAQQMGYGTIATLIAYYSTLPISILSGITFTAIISGGILIIKKAKDWGLLK